jgi:hypothetical protein
MPARTAPLPPGQFPAAKRRDPVCPTGEGVPPGARDAAGERWAQEADGRVLRPYALVGGRTRVGGADFDPAAIVSVVIVSGARRGRPGAAFLEEEHRRLLDLCPASVADLAAGLRLPAAVVRVILADLASRGFIQVRPPVPAPVRPPVQPFRVPDLALLRRVADGLRRL